MYRQLVGNLLLMLKKTDLLKTPFYVRLIGGTVLGYHAHVSKSSDNGADNA
jgi:hypothetical protein